MERRFSNSYWLKWTVACGIGEFLGIGSAAGIAFLHINFLGEPETSGQRILIIAVMMLAGIIEGSITGYFQWCVIRQRFVAIRARNWLGLTALGAATAWLLGMIPSVFFMSEPSTSSSTTFELSSGLVALFAALMGLVLGALFGAFQWIEFRKHVTDASKWILANCIAWTIGLAIIFVGASMPSEETGLATMIQIGTISGLLAGLSVGAITGLFLVKLGHA